MPKKTKKEEVVEEEVLEQEPVPEPAPQKKVEKKRIEGSGYTIVVYSNGETEKIYQ